MEPGQEANSFEAILMSTQNIQFRDKIKKKFSKYLFS